MTSPWLPAKRSGVLVRTHGRAVALKKGRVLKRGSACVAPLQTSACNSLATRLAVKAACAPKNGLRKQRVS